jgi:hypothetical protein
VDNHFPLVPGMKLFISNEIKGRYTKDTQGWDPGMDKYIGTIQTIKDVTRTSVMFKNVDFYWDRRDLISILCKDEIELTGKKQQFDVDELT